MTWLLAISFVIPAQIIAAVEQVESRGSWTALSSAGCVGVMQVCPRWSSVRPSWLLWLPPVNRWAGAKALAYWHKRARGDWPRALAGYRCGNAGLRGKCGRAYARAVLALAKRPPPGR